MSKCGKKNLGHTHLWTCVYLYCSYHILMTSEICYGTDAGQHGIYFKCNTCTVHICLHYKHVEGHVHQLQLTTQQCYNNARLYFAPQLTWSNQCNSSEAAKQKEKHSPGLSLSFLLQTLLDNHEACKPGKCTWWLGHKTKQVNIISTKSLARQRL